MAAPVERGLDGAPGDGEVRRAGGAGDVGAAAGIEGYGRAGVVAVAADEGRVDERVPPGGELRHEGVATASSEGGSREDE